MEKLLIVKVLKNTFLLTWQNRRLYSRVLVIPILILVCIQALWIAVDSDEMDIAWGFYFLNFIAFTYLAITCHKLVLAENKDIQSILLLKSIILIRFVVTSIIISLIAVLIGWIILSITIIIFPSSLIYIQLLIYIPIMYILSRFSLIFPAIALGFKPRLKWSWQETKDYQFSLFFIVAIFPWLLDILLYFFYRDNATIIEGVIISVFSYVCFALGIIALSLTYKELYLIQKQKE